MLSLQLVAWRREWSLPVVETIELLRCLPPNHPPSLTTGRIAIANPTLSPPPPQAEPALRIGAALEADAKRRTEARRDGTVHRQASILLEADRRRLVALIQPADDPPGAPEQQAPAAVAAPAAAAVAGGWLQWRQKKAATPASPEAAAGRQQQGAVAAGQQQQGEGLAGALLDLVDSVLVLDAVHRPGLGEVARRVRRVMEAIAD